MLDTLADNTLIFVVIYGIFYLLGSKNFYIPVLIVFLNLFIYSKKRQLFIMLALKKSKR